jgi:predicted phage tail protein
MQKVYLNGEISKFGKVWNTQCKNIGEVFKLISCQTPGFEQYMLNLVEEQKTVLKVVKGSEILTDVEDILMPIKEEDIIITEVPYGAGEDLNPLEMFLIGLTLFIAPHAYLAYSTNVTLGAAISTGFGTGFTVLGTIASIGVGLMVGGVAAFFAGGGETDINPGNEEIEKAKLFNGPTNVAKQGIPVPLLYGELSIGGANINQGFSVDQASEDQQEFPQHLKNTLQESLRFQP